MNEGYNRLTIRIISIFILLFVVASIITASLAIKDSLVDEYEVSSNLELVTKTEPYGSDGTLETFSYLNSDGVVTFAGDKGYAVLTRVRDDKNRLTMERCFDENNNPVMRIGDYHAVSYVYDGSMRIISYLDEELNPATITSGYSFVIRTYPYEDRYDYVDMFYDTNMNPTANTVNCYGIAYFYEGDLSTEYVWLDENSNPVNCRSGYARVVRTFDENKRVRTEMYFDVDNEPAANTNGEYGILISYNQDGRRESVTSLDASGQSMVNYAGYTTITYSYNRYGNIETETYYNLQHEPCTTGKGWYGKRHDGDRIYYLDISGNDIVSIDSFLSNYPFMVSVFGLTVCLLFILLPRKFNVAIMALYFIFIMYETILYRYSHQPTANMELFWSYKQFFTSEFLRIEILNNIWLFVPYSLGLLSVTKRKNILILLILLPIVIEIAQYVFGIGLFEFDDLISNGLGELIGAGIWYITAFYKKFTSIGINNYGTKL